jgi:hypothetical protein
MANSSVCARWLCAGHETRGEGIVERREEAVQALLGAGRRDQRAARVKPAKQQIVGAVCSKIYGSASSTKKPGIATAVVSARRPRARSPYAPPSTGARRIPPHSVVTLRGGRRLAYRRSPR